MSFRGVCILKGGVGLKADAEELARLNFKLRAGASVEPDLLVTVMGRPHAFLLLDERRAAAGQPDFEDEFTRRLSSLQDKFRQVYVLAPASHGHALLARVTARHSDVMVVTFSEMDDAVGAAARMVDAQQSSQEIGLGVDSIQAQQLLIANDEDAVKNTLQALLDCPQ